MGSRHLLSLMLYAVLPLASAAGLSQTSAFLPADQAFASDVWSEADGHTVAWTIAPGYYLYGHALAFEIDGQAVAADVPPGTPYHDAHFGEVSIYRDQLFVTLPTGSDGTELVIHYQGCADAGLCYPPQQRRYPLP